MSHSVTCVKLVNLMKLKIQVNMFPGKGNNETETPKFMNTGDEQRAC